MLTCIITELSVFTDSTKQEPECSEKLGKVDSKVDFSCQVSRGHTNIIHCLCLTRKLL